MYKFLYEDNLIPIRTWSKKIFRIMKLIFVALFLFATSIFATEVSSQMMRVSIRGNISTAKLLDEIEKQTDYLFVYNKTDINTERVINVKADNKTVAQVLKEIFYNTDIEYAIEGNSIMLMKSEKKSMNVTQQANKKVSGTVTDEKGEPLIGVNVSIENTSKGTITDEQGRFTIDAAKGENLVISYIGYISQRIKLGDQTSLNIQLKEDSKTLDEVVVVGFGTQKKVNLTGSVAVVDAKLLESRPVVNVTQALQGLVPGMNFNYASDGNGGDINQNMKINIRGNGTIGSGSNSSPLVLIDGMEGDMNVLNPQDIENISVLKDAAASSIYGSRAPFGVILITTKKGKAGKTSVNYNNSFRWSKATNMPTLADSYTYAQYFNRAAANNNETVAFDATKMEQIKGYLDGTFTPTTVPAKDSPTRWDWVGNSNNNWYDIYFGGTAFSQEHSLSANGGGENIQYYVSGNFLDQQGLITFNPDKLKRYTVTAKINAQVFSWMKINYSNKFMRKDYRKASYLEDNTFYHNIAKRWPTEPHLDPNGNVMSMAKNIINGGESKTQTDWLYQQLQVEVEPLPGWRIFGELNYKTISSFYHKDVLKVPSYDINNEAWYDSGAISSVTESAEKTNFFNPNVYSEYLKEFKGGHTLKGMVGFQSELNNFRDIGATRNDIISSELPTINSSSGKEKVNKGGYTHWSTVGFFARVNYDYQGRYLLEVNGRYDGTSRFAQNKRWNFFPSFSAGWNVTREEFMKPYDNVINTLKLRGSWGELGNQNTENLYPYIMLMKFAAADKDSHWLINNLRPNTANAPDLISALLGWETMRSWNVGVDMGFLNNRLNINFDWFNRKTVNMVGPAPELPVILGAVVPKTNNADMLSRGFELDITWKDNIGKVRYGAHLLLSDDRQKITNYPNKTGTLNTWRNGQYMGEIWGYTTQGIAKSDEEMKAWLENVNQSQLGSNWQAGDVMYVDVNGDGKINNGSNTINDHGDMTIIGNNTPRFKFGIDLDAAWNGFDFRVFLQGVAKRDYWFSDNMFWGAAGGKWQSTCFVNHLDFFRAEGDEWGANINGYFPRPTFDAGKNQKTQTRYLQNAAYMRIKNLQIGYTIPSHITRRAGISNFRVFFSGENLFTFSKLPDSFDPEILGTGYGATWGTTSAKTVPLSRTFSTGFSVNF